VSLLLPSLRGYSRTWIGADLLAGFTLEAVGVPESADPMRVRGLPAGGQMSFEGAEEGPNAADTLRSRR
jgi:hypothetical protein